MSVRYRLRRFIRRLVRPFKVRVLIFEHTRIRVRSFPPLFEHERVPSIQDLIDMIDAGAAKKEGGIVMLEAAEYILYSPLSAEVHEGRVALYGEGFDKTIVREES